MCVCVWCVSVCLYYSPSPPPLSLSLSLSDLWPVIRKGIRSRPMADCWEVLKFRTDVGTCTCCVVCRQRQTKPTSQPTSTPTSQPTSQPTNKQTNQPAVPAPKQPDCALPKRTTTTHPFPQIPSTSPLWKLTWNLRRPSIVYVSNSTADERPACFRTISVTYLHAAGCPINEHTQKKEKKKKAMAAQQHPVYSHVCCANVKGGEAGVGRAMQRWQQLLAVNHLHSRRCFLSFLFTSFLHVLSCLGFAFFCCAHLLGIMTPITPKMVAMRVQARVNPYRRYRGTSMVVPSVAQTRRKRHGVRG